MTGLLLASLLDALDGVAARLATTRLDCEVPGGEAFELKLRFLGFRGPDGPERRRTVERRLCQVFRAVHRARADLAALLAGVAAPEVPGRVARWFGGGPAAAVLGVLRKVHHGMRSGILTLSNLAEGDAIAYAQAPATVCLTPRYWAEPRGERRHAGILFHELTHLFARTTDNVSGCGAEVYIHEPAGESSFAWPVPEYHDNASAVAGGVFPNAADLVQLADTHECFLEECYLGAEA